MPQEMGPAPEAGAQPAAPQQGGQEQMMQQLMQIAQQLIQELGPEPASIVAQMILEQLQGGGQPPMPAPEQQPAFQRNGGRMNRIR